MILGLLDKATRAVLKEAWMHPRKHVLGDPFCREARPVQGRCTEEWSLARAQPPRRAPERAADHLKPIETAHPTASTRAFGIL